jgi:hypothetical protein
MRQIVFYSWQADLLNATNRGFIQEALEGAASAIASDASLAIEPVVDRDTQGVPGSPDIAATIFAKIMTADVFVADVTIIGRTDRRATPNPNVLIELGYALKALGHEKVILVFNRAFGKIDELPFDLRARRVLAYDMPADEKARGPERKMLERQLEAAIRMALKDLRREVDAIPAVSAIESQAPNRIIVLRRNLQAIFGELDRLKPRVPSAGGTVHELIAGLKQTQTPVAEFSKIAEMVAAMADAEPAIELHRWLGSILERYRHPEGFTGVSTNADHDYFKFLGHEMFVTLIAFYLREQRWSVLEQALAEPIPLRYLARMNGPSNVEWRYASEHLPSLVDESTRRRRISIRADLLNERHTTGGLSAVMPMNEFVGADYFLFLAGELRHPDTAGVVMEWKPWSAIYLRHAPVFLRNAERKTIADQLIKVLGMSSIEELRQKMFKRAPTLGLLFSNGGWDNPVGQQDIERLGTR